MSSPALFEQLDYGIDLLFTNRDMVVTNLDERVVELLGVAAELCTIPHPDFRSQLRARLMDSALAATALSASEVMASDVICSRPLPERTYPAEEQILPTLSGAGVGIYAVRRSNFAISVLAHTVTLALILTSGLWVGRRPEPRVQTLMVLEPSTSDYLTLDNAARSANGGGGSGDRGKLSASVGHLPNRSLTAIAPPEIVVRNENPKLGTEASVVVPPQLNLSANRLPNLGDPKSVVSGPPSNGTGYGGSFGSGAGLGIGEGVDGGVGRGVGGGYSGGIFRVGGGVTAPRAIYKPDPEYSPEARQAKYQGTVVVSLVVTPDGAARGLRVVRSLGMGLDEKALQAVRQWRFEPARKDGKPVAVAVDVEVNFRLF